MGIVPFNWDKCIYRQICLNFKANNKNIFYSKYYLFKKYFKISLSYKNQNNLLNYIIFKDKKINIAKMNKLEVFFYKYLLIPYKIIFYRISTSAMYNFIIFLEFKYYK